MVYKHDSQNINHVMRIQSEFIFQLQCGIWWFSADTPVSSTNKIDRHNITELLLKVALNTLTQT